MYTIAEINAKAIELGLEIESYQVKDPNYSIEAVESLRTDTCEFIDFGVCAENDEQIADWDVVTAEDYNNTIYSNCCDVQDDDVIVVVIKKRLPEL